METKGGFYITQIKQLQARIFERLLVENGISLSSGQGSILFVLWKTDRLTISEISRQTSLAKNTVSLIIDGMRETIISLTDYARSLQDKYEAVSQQMNTLFYQGFSPQERTDFEACLRRILNTLKDAELRLKSPGGKI